MNFIYLIVMFGLISCNNLSWKNTKSNFLQRSLSAIIHKKSKNTKGPMFNINKNDVFNIAFDEKLLINKKNVCRPEFAAKIKVLSVKKNQVVLKYKGLSKNKKFCKDGTKIIMTKKKLNQNIIMFFKAEKIFSSIQRQLQWIFDGAHNLKISSNRYVGDRLRLKNKDMLVAPAGLANTLPLKVTKQHSFTKAYLEQNNNQEGSLSLGKYCKVVNKNLKILGFIRSRAIGKSSIIVAQVRRIYTSGLFKLLGQLAPETNENNYCPTGSYVLVSSGDVI